MAVFDAGVDATKTTVFVQLAVVLTLNTSSGFTEMVALSIVSDPMVDVSNRRNALPIFLHSTKVVLVNIVSGEVASFTPVPVAASRIVAQTVPGLVLSL